MATVDSADERPSPRMYEGAFGSSFAELVTQLRDVLGVRLVAYIGGVKAASSVTHWATGTAEPDEGVRDRLRQALHIVLVLREVEPDEVIRSWFIGMDPRLDDRAPAEVLREGRSIDAMSAARGFVNAG